MEHTTTPLAAVISRRLELAGISLRAAARETGIATTTLQRKLNTPTPLRSDEVERLAGLLQCKVSEIQLEVESAA